MIHDDFLNLLSFFSMLRSQTSQDICCVVFALFNVVWATLFLERWKRREAELAYRWGTLDTPAESLEEPRPQFRVRERARRCVCATGNVIAVTSIIFWQLGGRGRAPDRPG